MSVTSLPRFTACIILEAYLPTGEVRFTIKPCVSLVYLLHTVTSVAINQGERTDLNGTYLTEEGTQAPPLSSVSLDTSVRCDTQPSWPTNGAWRLEQVAQRQPPDWRGRAKSQVSGTQAPQLLEPAPS